MLGNSLYFSKKLSFTVQKLSYYRAESIFLHGKRWSFKCGNGTFSKKTVSLLHTYSRKCIIYETIS